MKRRYILRLLKGLFNAECGVWSLIGALRYSKERITDEVFGIDAFSRNV